MFSFEYNDESKSERIYTDFEFQFQADSVAQSFQNEEAPVKQGPWGIHAFKPIQQERWEEAVAKEVENLIMAKVEDYYPYMTHVPEVAKCDTNNEDCRPRLYDKATKQWVLIDSCAQVSVWPKQGYTDAKLDNKLALQAVNGTRIPTYGTRTRQIKLGRKSYTKVFILADIQCPIIGWDFIKPNRLSLIWDDTGGLNFVDKKADISVPLRVEPVPQGTLLKLAPIQLADGHPVLPPSEIGYNDGFRLKSGPIEDSLKIAGTIGSTSVGHHATLTQVRPTSLLWTCSTSHFNSTRKQEARRTMPK